MRKIVMISHGKLAEGMSNTLNLFLGDHHDFLSISAYVDDIKPEEALKEVLNEIKEEDQLIILTDILGGSVNQAALPYLKRDNTYIFAGLNLPLAISLSMLPEEAAVEDFRRIVAEVKESIVLMNDFEFPNFEENDE